jgi:hypothetical protein
MNFVLNNNRLKRSDFAKGLHYSTTDYAFYFIEQPPFTQDFVLTINEIQISLGKDNICVEILGYCPFREWKINNSIKLPSYTNDKQLQAVIDFDTLPGCGYEVHDQGIRWPISVNKQSGWVCIGDPLVRKEASEFIDNCVAIVKDHKLLALWLRPQTLPPL